MPLKLRQIVVEMAPDRLVAAVELPKNSFDENDLVGALGALLSGRDVFQRVEHAEELDVVEMIGADPPSERRQIIGQDFAVGFDVDRQESAKNSRCAGPLWS